MGCFYQYQYQPRSVKDKEMGLWLPLKNVTISHNLYIQKQCFRIQTQVAMSSPLSISGGVNWQTSD